MKKFAPLLLVVLAACYAPEQPACSYRCGIGNLCPDNYECRGDDYCHLKGSPNEACQFPSPDGGSGDGAIMQDMAKPVDMAVTPDMTEPIDLSSTL